MNKYLLLAAKSISKASGLTLSEVQKIIEIPPNSRLGDISFPCFSIAKRQKPGNVAYKIREKLSVPRAFKKVEVMGPYLNFFLNEKILAEEIITSSMKKSFGKGLDNKKYVMDLFQANPFKTFHIGHLRNAVLGESLRRIIEYAGNKTYSISYVGDVGIHIAKWMWYFEKFYRGKIPKKDVSKWAGEIYVKAVNKINTNEEKFMIEVNKINNLIDSRDPKILKNWKKIRDACFNDADRIAAELGAKVNRRIPESEVEKIGRTRVLNLLKSGKVKKDQGAIILNLEKYNLGVFLLLKSDGTTLYSTKDIGLISTKQKIGGDRFIYVVGSEQEQYFKQLFKTFEILKISKESKNKHVSYGLVSLKEGKMSSRSGNVITYEYLRDTMRKKAFAGVKKHNPKLSKTKLENISTKIATGAMIFGMLKYSNVKPITFDLEGALRFEGATGPYLQYSLVRSSRILEKAKRTSGKPDYGLFEEADMNLVRIIANFPGAVNKARSQYQPSIVANYGLELVKSFNRFYEQSQVLNAEPNVRRARLKLVKSFNETLKKVMYLLAIPEVEQM